MKKVIKEETQEDKNILFSNISSGNPERISKTGNPPDNKTVVFPTVSQSLSYPPFYWPF